MPQVQRHLILSTAGHIDHGKTALVRALTGVNTDRLPEEKRRGMTIDIGFARLGLGGCDLGIVDVPGHERFVRNMLAGATGVDLVMLVVAADDSVMPQTREHVEILKLLSVTHGVIAITKCDLAGEQLLELVEQEIKDLVTGSFLEKAPVVRTSVTTGEGIETLKQVLAAVCGQVDALSDGEFFRMAIDRAFSVKGQGTVVTGSVAAGTIRIGDEVEWLPEQTKLRVRSLQTHDQSVDRVRRGQRAAIGLANVHHNAVSRGDELAAPGYLRPTRLVTARITVSRSSPCPVKHRATLRLHIGTGQTVTTVALLAGRQVAPGESAIVQMHLVDPVTAVCGQPFVLRSISPVTTLGGGQILQPVAGRIARRHATQIVRTEMFASRQAEVRAEAAIFDFGLRPWTDLDLCREAGITPNQVGIVWHTLAKQGRVASLSMGRQGTARLHAEVLSSAKERIVDVLRRYHKDHPLQAAMPRALLANLKIDDGLLTCLQKHMDEDRQVTLTADTIAQFGFTPKLTEQEQTLYLEIVQAFESRRFGPPSPGELARQTTSSAKVVQEMIDLGVSQNKLKHLGGDLFLSTQVERELRQVVVSAIQRSNGMTVSQIRQLLNTSRKCAVPLCEYLDREGITRRVGDERLIGRRVDGVCAHPQT